MNQRITIPFSSSIIVKESKNSSFANGILRICYHGRNRNLTDIPKDVIENNIDTMFNCPIVCNYIRESNEIGGHDVEIVQDDDGQLRMVNITTPVGVVPSNANYWWEEIIEDDGSIHEYLFVDVLIWKRQEAYSKIKEMKAVDQSMEINVKYGENVDGYYKILDFEFTAFCLLGSCEPCFESAALCLDSNSNFSLQFSNMMNDLKQEISQNFSNRDISNRKNLEGGTRMFSNIQDVLNKYNLKSEDINFDYSNMSPDELNAKLEQMKYGLTIEQLVQGIIETLRSEVIINDWGESIPRYCYVDCDLELKEVFYYDSVDWYLYGSPFVINGDKIEIDLTIKKRKKFVIADYIEGDIDISYNHIYDQISETVKVDKSEYNRIKDKYETDVAELTSKYSQVKSELESVNSELNELREFKNTALAEQRKTEENNVFSKFTDLDKVDAFIALKNDSSKYTIEELTDKCFAIRGRMVNVGKKLEYNNSSHTPKIPIGNHDTDVEKDPYGSLFKKYGSKNR